MLAFTRTNGFERQQRHENPDGESGGSVGGMVRGVVMKGNQTVSDCLVAMIPSPPHRGNLNLYKTAATDQNGTFTIRGAAPGEYEVLAWEDIEPNAWLNQDFLKPFESRAQHLSLVNATSADVTVRVIP